MKSSSLEQTDITQVNQPTAVQPQPEEDFLLWLARWVRWSVRRIKVIGVILLGALVVVSVLCVVKKKVQKVSIQVPISFSRAVYSVEEVEAVCDSYVAPSDSSSCLYSVQSLSLDIEKVDAHTKNPVLFIHMKDSEWDRSSVDAVVHAVRDYFVDKPFYSRRVKAEKEAAQSALEALEKNFTSQNFVVQSGGGEYYSYYFLTTAERFPFDVLSYSVVAEPKRGLVKSIILYFVILSIVGVGVLFLWDALCYLYRYRG